MHGYNLPSTVLCWHLSAGISGWSLRTEYCDTREYHLHVAIRNDTSVKRKWTIGYIINVDENQERTKIET